MYYNELFNEAENCYCDGFYEKSLKLFKKVYSLNPSNSVLNYIGCNLLNLKNYDKAEKVFKSLISTTHWETPWYNLGRLYLKKKMNEKALNCFQEALAINPNNDNCHFYMGVYNEKLCNYRDAIECYRNAINLSDDNYDKAMYYTNSGVCYAKLDEVVSATECYDKAINLCRDYEDAYVNKRKLFDVEKSGEKDNDK